MVSSFLLWIHFQLITIPSIRHTDLLVSPRLPKDFFHSQRQDITPLLKRQFRINSHQSVIEQDFLATPRQEYIALPLLFASRAFHNPFQPCHLLSSANRIIPLHPTPFPQPWLARKKDLAQAPHIYKRLQKLVKFTMNISSYIK